MFFRRLVSNFKYCVYKYDIIKHNLRKQIPLVAPAPLNNTLTLKFRNSTLCHTVYEQYMSRGFRTHVCEKKLYL